VLESKDCVRGNLEEIISAERETIVTTYEKNLELPGLPSQPSQSGELGCHVLWVRDDLA
jgi:hypothetical protein